MPSGFADETSSRYDPEPIWLTVDHVIALHGAQLAIFGGLPGLRDAGGLASAVGRPRFKWTYGERDMTTLAATYAYGIARTHPFADGNKRAAFAALMVFLRVNSYVFSPPPGVAAAAMFALADGTLSEAELVRWVCDIATRR
jgi:death on curing protein